MECFRIRVDGRNRVTTAWIEKESHLVRRVEDTLDETTTTINYEPQIDVFIPEKDFDYNPPRSPMKDLDDHIAYRMAVRTWVRRLIVVGPVVLTAVAVALIVWVVRRRRSRH